MDLSEFNDSLDYLLDSLEGRLNPAHLDQSREYRDVGEETLAVDSIAYSIHHDHIPLTRTECAKLRYLLYYYSAPTKWEPSIQNRDEIMASLTLADREET